MMLHKKSNPSRLFKLIALVPIVAVALAVNAETVTDYVYGEPETQQPIKKGKKAGTIKIGNQEIKVEQSAAETQDGQPGEKFIAKGRVVDDQNSPIVGAIVQIAGTKKGTVTDRDGKFSLEVSVGDKITASYIGLESFTIGVSKSFSEKNEYILALPKETEGELDPNKVFDVVEQMPQFPGGTGKLFEYLAKNVRYPKEAEDICAQGRVIATFVVEKDGSVSNAKVVRSIDPVLDAEALRVINGMPNWNPGMQNGEPVRVKYTVPISFRLQGGGAIHEEKEKHANQLGETVVVGYGRNDSKLVSEVKNVVVKTVDNAPLKLGLSNEKGIVYVVNGQLITDSKKIEVQTSDIESIHILKNKEAIEKYGEKAKNGVIIITTKK